MRSTERGAGTRLELWIQPTPSVRQEYEPVVRELGKLARRGTIEAFDVETWDRYLGLEEPDDPRALDALSSFAHWAWQHGGDLPNTERLRVGYGRMGPARTVQRTPRAILAEYRDGVLVHVTPCVDEVCLVERLRDMHEETALEGGLRRARERIERSKRTERASETKRRETRDRDRDGDESRTRERLVLS